MPEVEIFTPTGVIAGSTARTPLTDDGPDLVTPIAVGTVRWYPIDGAPPARRPDLKVAPDDILLIVTPEPDLKVHMARYSIVVELGPYRVSGSLATLPGFDPAKAIARPSSQFVPLRDAMIELVGQDDAGSAERPYVHVNRYAVESVTSTLMLGYYFPGARFAGQESVAVG